MPQDFHLPRSLPGSLEGLKELALDVRWCWNRSADPLWQAIDPEMWEASRNPWLLLATVSHHRLQELAHNRQFCAELRTQKALHQHYLTRTPWFHEVAGAQAIRCVAFFSMEFGLSETMPIYSGGLGIMAGDHLKAASDLGVPTIGIGLLYQQGYFRQAIGPDGEQLHYYPANDFSMLPASPLRDASGRWLRIPVDLPGRSVKLRAWQVRIGRSLLYLLDSNDPGNLPGDRGITGELYGGSLENRLHQEIALGIGGARLLNALNIDAAVYHLNEAHGALALLERARLFMKATGLSFSPSLLCTRAGNVFTSHTTKPDAFEQFPADLIEPHLKIYAEKLGIPASVLLDLGRSSPEDPREPFNLAYLAVRACNQICAVSRSHREVSRLLFEPLFPRWPLQEVPVDYVTSGVHMPSWESTAADDLWTIACGLDCWLGDANQAGQDVRRLSDEALWAVRSLNRKSLVESLQKKTARQLAVGKGTGRNPAKYEFDANTLILGIACQFTEYKRPALLLHDPDRLIRLLHHPERPVQLVVAGKAHPNDEAGKRMVRAWALFMRRPETQGRMIFLEDFDMALARELALGVDLWIHTPRRHLEASGTGGMKVLVNGGLNLSSLDGWWAEAYAPEVGWALQVCNAGGDEDAADAIEAGLLLQLLEEEVVPSFYARNEQQIPVGWLSRVRESMARLAPHFSAHRMLREYTERFYGPCANALMQRCADKAAGGLRLHQWQLDLARSWDGVRFGHLDIESSGETSLFRVQVRLGDVARDSIRVELYADPCDGQPAARHEMSIGEPLPGEPNGFWYQTRIKVRQPLQNYTPRILPRHPDAVIPAEESHCLWQR